MEILKKIKKIISPIDAGIFFAYIIYYTAYSFRRAARSSLAENFTDGYTTCVQQNTVSAW